MCKLELLSDSIHTKRLNQNDHSNNEHSHSNNNNNMDDYVMMKSFSKQYESIQYTNECSNNQFVKENTLNKSNNDCLNVTIVDHLKIDNHNHTTDNDNDNSTVNCFPIMNGLFESLHQASIEIDSLQNSPFLSSIHSKDYCNSTTNSYCTTIDTNTTTTTMTTSLLCTENNSYTESLSLSSHTSSASISPALSFDTFTTPSLTTTTTSSSSSPLSSSSSLLFDEQSSALMLMNSFNNLNLTNNSSHSFISKEICCSNFTITNSS
ncbi:SH3 domain-binding protein 5 [Schistosoma haematobium]|nr:SH3 domain-binding protein 5 [Schistosoma haematobium]KAH9583875.1 SH3 domain-binding protein 5 [Schistosoma haematobium]